MYLKRDGGSRMRKGLTLVGKAWIAGQEPTAAPSGRLFLSSRKGMVARVRVESGTKVIPRPTPRIKV
jgi:hypothetical protein